MGEGNHSCNRNIDITVSILVTVFHLHCLSWGKYWHRWVWVAQQRPCFPSTGQREEGSSHHHLVDQPQHQVLTIGHYMCMCVCVCDRERDRQWERERVGVLLTSLHTINLWPRSMHNWLHWYFWTTPELKTIQDQSVPIQGTIAGFSSLPQAVDTWLNACTQTTMFAVYALHPAQAAALP